jgi:predicted acyltransferase
VGRLLNRTHIGSGPDAPSTYQWLYQTLFASWAGPMSGSLLFAIAMVLLWWLTMYGFYRRGWFLKV